MDGRGKKKNNRIRNLILICTLSSIILIVSTYAWFVGLQSVSVSSFDIEIKAADSLMLSLDGATWSPTINLNKDNIINSAYEDNTNSWGGENTKGIFPISTIGELDDNVSRLKLYEMTSFNAAPGNTPGGYRLMVSRVKNDTTESTEQDGYVAFDLFIRNFTGEQYIQPLNELDEESIYLTTDSKVTVATTGVETTGIENSVRVAFAQIGRVSGDSKDGVTVADITGITCSDSEVATEGDVPVVTGICRTAQIWEPNDVDHVVNATRYYNTSCLKRLVTGTDVTLAASYSSDACNTVEQGKTYRTYAVKNAIASSNNVNIYDGADYNGYTSSSANGTCTGGTVPTTKNSCLASYGKWTATDTYGCTGTSETYCTGIGGSYNSGDETCTGGTAPTEQNACEAVTGATWAVVSSEGTCSGENAAYCKSINGTYEETTGVLSAYPYFTDTMKMLTGTNRPTFMTLAPNSITKVRVYVYIEGQDIDNYDFAAVGRKIAVTFGFTKERYVESDTGYDGPSLTYTVDFNVGDGTPTPAAQTITAGGKVTVPLTIPTVEDKTFKHWAIEGGETAFDFTTEKINDDLTLVAVYEDVTP